MEFHKTDISKYTAMRLCMTDNFNDSKINIHIYTHTSFLKKCDNILK